MKVWLVKAYLLCPAFAYFKFHYPEAPTPSMEEGSELDLTEIVERNLKTECPVKYEVPLNANGLKGIVDALIECNDSIEIVEVKLRQQPGHSHFAQALFYCILAEEALGKKCDKVFLCYPEKCYERKVSEASKEYLTQIINTMEKDLETLPRVKSRAYCKYCKYSRLCPWSPRN